MRKLIIVAALVAAAFGAGQVSAVSMSTDETNLRARLTSCVILEAAAERRIALRRLPITRYQCELAR